jgi:outer membrane lipoprotein-sorting protein
MPNLFLVLFLLLPQTRVPSELVDQVSRTYGRLNSFSADFEQISEDSSNQRVVQRGHVYLKTGRKALFEYSAPRKMSEYFLGKTYTQYVPEIEQALQYPINQADADLLAIIQVVGNRETPWKNYFSRFDESAGNQGNRVVALTPKNKDLTGVEIEVDPGTFFIVRMVIRTAEGQRNQFRFTNIKTAPPLPDSLFKFVAPPGVKVIKN